MLLWFLNATTETLEKWLYSLTREELEDLDYYLMEKREDFDLLAIVAGVMLATDPSLTAADIERLNEAAARFLEEANR